MNPHFCSPKSTESGFIQRLLQPTQSCPLSEHTQEQSFGFVFAASQSLERARAGVKGCSDTRHLYGSAPREPPFDTRDESSLLLLLYLAAQENR